MTENTDYLIYGMMSSYFTKKLEAYFLVKGIPYRFVELDNPIHLQCAEEIGVTQFPHVRCPDGTWLTDTTPIIEHFEADESLLPIRPKDRFTAFCSYFLEDCFDECLWAPALYYRWAFKMDHKRRSEEFSYTLISNGLPLPRSIMKRIVTWRQKLIHIQGNGIVSAAHARHIEELYLDTLDLLQPVLEARPYLFGLRPCEADFGLFGPMMPHFGLDPTPQEIMHVRAPHVFRWLGRLWSTRPEEVLAAPELTEVPDDLKPLMQKMAAEYLPYLQENQRAYESGSALTRYRLGNLDWEAATAPYRVYCLSQLQRRYQALDESERQQCRDFLGDAAIEVLSQAINCPPQMQNVTAARPSDSDRPVHRLWQAKTTALETLSENIVRKRQSKATPELKREGTAWLPIYFRRYRARSSD